MSAGARKSGLISVDQAVGKLVQTLKDKGILDDTYIIFSSDNGFFRGKRASPPGSTCPTTRRRGCR